MIGLHLTKNGVESVRSVDYEDFVFFTNGSMTQNSTRGIQLSDWIF